MNNNYTLKEIIKHISENAGVCTCVLCEAHENETFIDGLKFVLLNKGAKNFFK